MIKYLKRTTSNIGDNLSTPDNYFDISASEPTWILGGGSYDLLGMEYENISRTIVWGVGTSIKLKNIDVLVKELPFLAWSSRDIDFVNSNRFVPCASCFNDKILKDPIGDEKLYILNAEKKLRIGKDVLYNSASLNEFTERWQKASVIITNSYHAIYWALLSNRKVVPLGYSSKFISLFRCFDIKFPMTNFYDDKAEKVSLSTMDTRPISVDSKYYLDKFRSLNLEFADSLPDVKACLK
jgi:hypothetical protein